MLKNKAVIGMI